jgi:hypothetical protein
MMKRSGKVFADGDFVVVLKIRNARHMFVTMFGSTWRNIAWM